MSNDRAFRPAKELAAHNTHQQLAAQAYLALQALQLQAGAEMLKLSEQFGPDDEVAPDMVLKLKAIHAHIANINTLGRTLATIIGTAPEFNTDRSALDRFVELNVAASDPVVAQLNKLYHNSPGFSPS